MATTGFTLRRRTWGSETAKRELQYSSMLCYPSNGRDRSQAEKQPEEKDEDVSISVAMNSLPLAGTAHLAHAVHQN